MYNFYGCVSLYQLLANTYHMLTPGVTVVNSFVQPKTFSVNRRPNDLTTLSAPAQGESDFFLPRKLGSFCRYVRQLGGGYVIVLSVCLSVCHSVTRITEKVISQFHLTWCYDWAYQSEELINFWWGSGPRYGFRITFPFSSLLQNKGF